MILPVFVPRITIKCNERSGKLSDCGGIGFKVDLKIIFQVV